MGYNGVEIFFGYVFELVPYFLRCKRLAKVGRNIVFIRQLFGLTLLAYGFGSCNICSSGSGGGRSCSAILINRLSTFSAGWGDAKDIPTKGTNEKDKERQV